MSKEKDFMTITNIDIYNKVEEQGKTMIKILNHAEYTNGKIAAALLEIEELRKNSLGMWVKNHPFRFTLLCISSLSVITPDTREIIFTLVKNFFL